ncbi:MAG: glutathione S-transferase [Thermoleophilaceae bacterium]|nr:glutathione S-transferase [Thermoleophilaceae bacterium]
MRLHDNPSSGNCYKVRLLLAQLGLPYERVHTDIFAGASQTEEFARLNPARQVPVLEPDEGEPLPESNAILVHLAEGTGLLPGDPAARAQALRWLFFEQSEIVPSIAGLRFRVGIGRLAPGDRDFERRHAAGAKALRVLDERLRSQPFLAGERYSIADISVYAYVHVAGEAGLDLSGYPAVQDWIARVEATPGHMDDLRPIPRPE